MLEEALSKTWRLVLLRGTLHVAFGVLIVTQPSLTLATLVVVFGAFLGLEGCLVALAALRIRRLDPDWWYLLVDGAFGILVGALAFSRPLVTTRILLLCLATWATVTGVLRLIAAIRIRHLAKEVFWMGFGGLVSILFGLLTLWSPATGTLVVAAYVGAWALVAGASLVGLAFHLKGLGAAHQRRQYDPTRPLEQWTRQAKHRKLRCACHGRGLCRVHRSPRADRDL